LDYVTSVFGKLFFIDGMNERFRLHKKKLHKLNLNMLCTNQSTYPTALDHSLDCKLEQTAEVFQRHPFHRLGTRLCVFGFEYRDAFWTRPVLQIGDRLLQTSEVVGSGARLAGHLNAVVMTTPAKYVFVGLQQNDRCSSGFKVRMRADRTGTFPNEFPLEMGVFCANLPSSA
jgi:hypothetical protein